MSKVNYLLNEQVLGVLGLSPYATIDFLRKLADETPANKDWEHLRVIIDLNTKIPSRGRALDLGEENPSTHIRDAILELKKRKADFVVIPCNTVHYFYKEITQELPVKVLNMIEENSRYIVNNFPKIRKVGILASKTTTNHGLYENFLNEHDISVINLPHEQARITQIIEEVKVGNDTDRIKNESKILVEELVKQGAEAIILGCTELPLVINQGDFRIPILDTNKILAKSCLKIIKG